MDIGIQVVPQVDVNPESRDTLSYELAEKNHIAWIVNKKKRKCLHPVFITEYNSKGVNL